jgi:hypothetical protein
MKIAAPTSGRIVLVYARHTRLGDPVPPALPAVVLLKTDGPPDEVLVAMAGPPMVLGNGPTKFAPLPVMVLRHRRTQTLHLTGPSDGRDLYAWDYPPVSEETIDVEDAVGVLQ